MEKYSEPFLPGLIWMEVHIFGLPVHRARGRAATRDERRATQRM